MDAFVARAMPVLAGLWAGALLGIAFAGAPAAFATVAPEIAGRIAGWMFAREALATLLLCLLFFWFARGRARRAARAGEGSALSAELLLVLGVLFCNVAGYYALQPMMEAARAGQVRLSFGALHGISMAFFAVKTLLVVVLAWRLTPRRAS